MSREISLLEPETRDLCEKFLNAALAHGQQLVVTQTLRSYEEQAKLYAEGRSMAGAIVTNAPPGYSWHNFGRAFDVAFRVGVHGVTYHGPWERMGLLAEQLGLEWGGRWGTPDVDHFEYRGGFTLARLREIHDGNQQAA